MKLKKKTTEQKTKKGKELNKPSQPVPEAKEEVSEKLLELSQLLDEIDEELKGVKPTYEDQEQIQAEVIKEQKAVKAASRPNKKEVKNTDNLVTVKELAVEFKMESKKLRKWLRNNMARSDGRWEWEEGDPDLAKIRKAFGKK